MEEVFLKPREGLKVRLENGMGFVEEGGQFLPLTAYYRRRLLDGDLIETKPVKGK